MFIKLSYLCNDRKLFCELASTCLLAASGFCKERKSAFTPFTACDDVMLEILEDTWNTFLT